jgi:hypothetical protein
MHFGGGSIISLNTAARNNAEAMNDTGFERKTVLACLKLQDNYI